MPDTPNAKEAVNVKIENIFPLQALQVDMLILGQQETETERGTAIYFMNQMTGQVFDFQGPVSEGTEEGIKQWIRKKNEEMHSRLATATPEQLRSMGIDVNSTAQVGKKIIMG